MRSFLRTTDRQLTRAVALVCLADGLVGAAFGAVTVDAGLPGWLPVLLSLVVFAGASQLLFIGVLAAGGGPIAAAVAGLLVNLRHLPFGFAVADVLHGGWWLRLVGAHLMTDEATAFTLAQTRTRRPQVEIEDRALPAASLHCGCRCPPAGQR
jgi:predicted branched-subunit amino acid permease